MRLDDCRVLSKFCLFFSIFPLFFIGHDNLCYDFTGKSDIIDLSEINGSGGDDGAAFVLLAVVTLVWLPFLSLVRNKIIFL